MNRILLMAGGLLLVVALLLSVNLLAGATLRSARLDMTQDGLYTLSEGSKRILEKAREAGEKLTLRFFFSEKLAQEYPPLPDYGKRIEELLLDYSRRSGGIVDVEVLDPEPFTETEDRAVQYGLKPVPVRNNEALYFGLAGTNSVGDTEVIPFFQPDREAFLEYDLTKLVHALASPDKTVVGVMSSLPLEGALDNPFAARQMPQPWFVMEQIRQTYETKSVPPASKEIPAEVDVLWIVHPKDLQPQTLYAIDQFVLRGGKALVFVDPFCEVDESGQDPSNPMSRFQARKDSNLKTLFDAWGVELVEGQIAADLGSALNVRFNNRGREEQAPFVVWLGLKEDSLSSEEVAIDQLKFLRMHYPGVLERTENATTELVPLVQTTEKSQQIPTSRVQFMADPASLLADFLPTNRRQVLAARISGQVKTAFPEGKPKAPEGAEPPDEEAPDEAEKASAEHLAESREAINVIVVADCDMLADPTWVQTIDLGGYRLGTKTSDNGDLVTNALDFLGGSTDLISLRSRGVSTRPFTVVEALQKEAEQEFRAEEQRLTRRFDEIERELTKLVSEQEGGAEILMTPEIEAQVAKLTDEKLATRKRLREVRRDLRRDIESLGTGLKLLNLIAVPFLVLVTALALAYLRSTAKKPS